VPTPPRDPPPDASQGARPGTPVSGEAPGTRVPRFSGSVPSTPSTRGWEPYLVPYAAFLVVVQVGAWLPTSAAAWVLPVQVALPAVLLGLYVRGGHYRELGGWRARGGGLAADVALGLAVAALWMVPYAAGWLAPPEAGFDAGAWGEEGRGARLALRAAGFVAVTPFVEELFVRSFLIRWVELFSWRGGRLEYDASRDFRDLPMARYTAWSFWITVVYFALSHALWEVPVAAAAGVLYNLWLYRSRHLADVILAHAVTNGTILAVVVVASARGADLWYFL